MRPTIAVLVDHQRPALVHLHTHKNKPIFGANLAHMAGHGIHHPKALTAFRQVSGTVGQQVPTADAVVALGPKSS